MTILKDYVQLLSVEDLKACLNNKKVPFAFRAKIRNVYLRTKRQEIHKECGCEYCVERGGLPKSVSKPPKEPVVRKRWHFHERPEDHRKGVSGAKSYYRVNEYQIVTQQSSGGKGRPVKKYRLKSEQVTLTFRRADNA